MKFHLKKREKTGEGTRRISRELRTRVREILRDESLDADTAVHELRKCIKKLRAVLRFSRPAIKRKVLRKTDAALRDFARRFSGTRDSAVMVKTFDALMAHYRPFLSADDMLPVRQSLQNRHVLAMAAYQDDIESRDLADDFRRADRLLERIGDISMSHADALSGLREVYSRGRKRLRALQEDPSTENSHALRRQAKYLWYQVTLLRKHLPGDTRSLIDALEELGELLGNDNDMAVLVDTLNEHPSICCNRVRAELVTSLAETRRIALLSEALRVATRIYRYKPGRFLRELISSS